MGDPRWLAQGWRPGNVVRFGLHSPNHGGALARMLTHEADCTAVIPVAWVLTAGGMVNLAHAYEVSYDKNTESMTVWWVGNFPSDADRTERSGIYDQSRLTYHHVTADEYDRFMRNVIANT